MSQQAQSFAEHEFDSERSQRDRIRVEKWLDIAEVLRWSAFLRTHFAILMSLALSSGLVCGIWLNAKQWGIASWIVAFGLFVGLLIMLTVSRSFISAHVEKMRSEMDTDTSLGVTVDEARRFADAALARCHARGSVSADTTVENFRRIYPRHSFGGRFNPICVLAVTIQALLLASFGLAGCLSKFTPASPVVAQALVVQPLPNAVDESKLHTPLPEMPVETPPVQQSPPVIAKTNPQPAIHPDAAPSPPPSVPEMPESRLREFVKAQIVAENRMDLSTALPRYSESLRKDRERELRLLKTTTEQVQGEIRLKPAGRERWEAAWLSSYSNETPSGSWEKGRKTTTVILGPANDEFQILERQILAKREKGGWNTPPEIESEIKQRVQELVQVDKAKDLERTLALYAPKVDYFGAPKYDRAAIGRSKASDFQKWIKRNYQVTSPPIVTALGDGKWRASFGQSFECENDAEVSRGKIATVLVFQQVEGSLRIVGQTGPVSDARRIAKNTPPITEPPPIVAAPPPGLPEIALPPAPAEGPMPLPSEEAPDPRFGIIHKVPELKDLVDRRLTNRWLYGEFSLHEFEGNAAYCRTYGRGILLEGEGSTTLEIEFAGGIDLGSAVSRILDSGGTFLFYVPVNDPIQLLSVTKDRSGKIRVRARSQRGLGRRGLLY